MRLVWVRRRAMRARRSSVSIDSRKGDDVAELTAIALAPDDPSSMMVTKPLDPREFRKRVEGPVQELTNAASLVALLMGAVSIANSATAAVFTRQAEIGLRSILGAQPSHIFTQITFETAAVGASGGLIGVALGSLLTTGIAIWNDWPILFDLGRFFLALFAALVAGVLAGFPAAQRALRIQPVVALRS